MEIPQTFLEDLEIEFQGRLRARYSNKLNAVLIEQRVGKNIIPSLPRKFYSDDRRQSLAEGYMPLMTVAISEIMRCPECCMRVEVPNRETKQIKCLYCQLKGRATKIIAGFYPLNSFLINHLKSIDPLRNMDSDQIGAMETHNEKVMAQQQKQLYDDAESYSYDNFNQLAGILQTGYSHIKGYNPSGLRK